MGATYGLRRGLAVAPRCFMSPPAPNDDRFEEIVEVGGIVARPFDDDQIAALVGIRWWDWPDDLIVERVGVLCHPDITRFVEQFDPGI